VKLPIDVVPNTRSLIFRWQQTVDSPIGRRTVEHEGVLPLAVEGVVAALIALAKEQAEQIEVLRGMVARWDAT